MAFTYCTNCGEKIDIEQTRCPHCGHVVGSKYSYGAEPHNRENPNGGQGNAQGQGYAPRSNNPNGQGYNPNGQGYNPNGQGYNPNGQGYNPNGQGYYNGDPRYGAPMYRTPMGPPKRPVSVGLVIFSIINMIFSCCTFTSLIFGVIALVYTMNARNARSEAEETAKKKTALILNIVGLVIGVLSAVSFAFMFVEILEEIIAAGTL